MVKHDVATCLAAREFVGKLVDSARLTQPEYERVIENVLKALPPYAMSKEVIAAERKRLGIRAFTGSMLPPVT